MQVFRLMGMPDKVIAFDELPKDYLLGLDMCDCTKLGRDWRKFIGEVERITKVKPEMDPISHQMNTFPALSEKAPYAYLIDWELNHDKERWSEIVEYVRKNAPVMWEQEDEFGNKRQVRMTDDLERMALPFAKDAHSELTLEPEHVNIVPLKKIIVEPSSTPTIVADPVVVQDVEGKKMFKCDECDKEFAAKQGVALHKIKKHPKVAA